jgi:hypothetical protein
MISFPDTRQTLFTVLLAFAAHPLPAQTPPAHADLTGRWRVSIAKSDDPFTMLSFDSSGAAARPQGSSGGSGGRPGGGSGRGFSGSGGSGGSGGGFGGRGMGGGRRGGGSGQPRSNALPALSDSQRQAFRQALRLALYGPPLLQIAQDDSALTFGADTAPLVLHGDGRTLVIPPIDSTAEVHITARWLGNAFLVSREVVGGGRVTEDYVKSADGTQVTVYVHFDGGVGRSLDFRRVYDLIGA